MTDREMILSPYKWPYVYLPLKRRNANGFPDIGLLRTATSRPDVDFIVDENLSIFGPVGEVTRHTYKSVDELLAAGWVVD